MRRKLPSHMLVAFDIRAPLRGEVLHTSALELVEFYNSQLNMIFPSVNYPLIMYKHIRDLGLPSEFLLHTNTRSTVLIAEQLKCTLELDV